MLDNSNIIPRSLFPDIPYSLVRYNLWWVFKKIVVPPECRHLTGFYLWIDQDLINLYIMLYMFILIS